MFKLKIISTIVHIKLIRLKSWVWNYMAEGIRRNRNVKIVATLGPASSTEEMVSKLFEEGVDVFRLNLSHGLHSEIKKRHEIIRRVEKKFGRPICILADLQGPK